MGAERCIRDVARAAGAEAEAAAVYAALPIDQRTRPLTLQEQIHG